MALTNGYTLKSVSESELITVVKFGGRLVYKSVYLDTERTASFSVIDLYLFRGF